MEMERGQVDLLNELIKATFNDALKASIKDPSQAAFFLRTLMWQRKAADIRMKREDEGIHVPPIMILSTTDRCNLNCAGCYAKNLRKLPGQEMSEEKLRGLFKEARDLGFSIILLAGGEPLVRKDLLSVTKDFPEVIFPLFTNGLLIDEPVLNELKRQRNVIPIVSIEGYEEDTDRRRGMGVYDRLRSIMEKLDGKKLFYGVSLTVTRSNYDTITDKKFVEGLKGHGCKAFMFVEYSPVKEGTEGWVITEEQRAKLLATLESFRNTIGGVFVTFPGDEKQFGGCLSAGRGFVHVSSSGDLEPCPFAPFSDSNVRDMPLKDALQSKFLQAIRNEHEEMMETDGGCAVWKKREWVQSLIAKPVAGDIDGPAKLDKVEIR